MGSVVLISTVAIVVAIVGCIVIWRLDASRAEEIERTAPPPDAPSRPGLDGGSRTTSPRSIDS